MLEAVLKALHNTDFTSSLLKAWLGTGGQSNTTPAFLFSHTPYKSFYHAGISIHREKSSWKADQSKKEFKKEKGMQFSNKSALQISLQEEDPNTWVSIIEIAFHIKETAIDIMKVKLILQLKM